MLLSSMTNYLSGVVRIKVSGQFPEKFINLCIADGMSLWNIMQYDDFLIVSMRLDEFFLVRPLVVRTKVKINVLSCYGLPFVKKRIRGRKILALGAILCIIAIYTLTSFVWVVDIVGAKTVDESRIKEIVGNYGLTTGTHKTRINIKNIENAISYHIPEIAWVSVSITGTRSIIEVVEKTVPPLPVTGLANLCAAKDGIITKIITIYGQPAVKVGDAVKTGDLLIRRQATSAEKAQDMRAAGIVTARVTYVGEAEVRLREEKFLRTGRQKSAINLRILDMYIPIKSVNPTEFPIFETEEANKNLLEWRKEDFTVEIYKVVYYEMERHFYEQSFEAARSEAKDRALAQVQEVITPHAHIVTQMVTDVVTEDEDLIKVRVVIEADEEIGELVKAE